MRIEPPMPVMVKAAEEGWRARIAGHVISACPYNRNHLRKYYWVDGWEAADAAVGEIAKYEAEVDALDKLREELEL